MRRKVPIYKEGDIRSCKGFLLFPKTIRDERRWLEYTKWIQLRYYDGYDLIWKDYDWID